MLNNNNVVDINGLIQGSSKRRKEWNLKASDLSTNTINPIRSIVEGLKIEPNPEKHLIPLSIGEYWVVIEVGEDKRCS